LATVVALFLVFSTAAMAQVEHPSQISVQAITPRIGVRPEYRGLVYKIPDFGLNSLNLDKVTHRAQPSLGFFYRF